MQNRKIMIYTLPGGKLPERKTEGAIGYDVYLRAIVSCTEMDSKNALLRKTLFDFKNVPDDPEVAKHVKEQPKEGGGTELVYQMDPEESVLVGVGFTAAMKFPMFYWVAPRSGLASKWGITVTNAPGTVDPDYRGEAGVLVYNRNKHSFPITHNMRIAQIVFQVAIIPEFTIVNAQEELPPPHVEFRDLVQQVYDNR